MNIRSDHAVDIKVTIASGIHKNFQKWQIQWMLLAHKFQMIDLLLLVFKARGKHVQQQVFKFPPLILKVDWKQIK